MHGQPYIRWSYKSTLANGFVVLYHVRYYRIRNCVLQSNITSLSAVFTDLMLHLMMMMMVVVVVTWPNRSINAKCKILNTHAIIKINGIKIRVLSH